MAFGLGQRLGRTVLAEVALSGGPVDLSAEGQGGSPSEVMEIFCISQSLSQLQNAEFFASASAFRYTSKSPALGQDGDRDG